MMNNFLSIWPKKKADIVILISKQIDFKLKLTKGDKKEHLIIFIKVYIHQKDTAIVNIYAPKKWALNFIKETLLQFKLHIGLYMDSGIFQYPTLANRQVI